MDINYFMKIQNSYGTKNKREKELAKINYHMSKHFEDTFDTEDVLINGIPAQLMIIRDTDGNTYKKKIKSTNNEKFNLGDYVEWDGQKWLIALIDSDERTWSRGYMYLCTVPLRWQNTEGKIIERWAYSEDFTKYSSGTKSNNTITIGDNQYGLTLPIDNETKQINRDMRFPIDFDDSERPDIYMLTNRKTHLNNNTYFGRGGIITFTVTFDAFNQNNDKKIIMDNGQEVWICDYNKVHTPLLPKPSVPNKKTGLTAIISGNKCLRNGYCRTYTVMFKDQYGKTVDWKDVNFRWNVIADFYITQTIYENKIDLNVDDENLIGFSFLLQVFIGNVYITDIELYISE